MPGEEHKKRHSILISDEPVHALGQRNGGAGEDGTGVTGSAAHKNDLQVSSRGTSVLTSITATATPRQQYVGHDVSITGQLTADGAPIAGAPIKLYAEGAGFWSKVSDTTTDAQGGYAFTVQQPTAGTRAFKVAYPGSAMHEPSVSDELSVTYVTVPTAITAIATPQQPYVGQSVTITGQLTANGLPVADLPVTLYNADDIIERVYIADTTTDASGYYQFTLTEAVPSHHSDVVHAPEPVAPRGESRADNPPWLTEPAPEQRSLSPEDAEESDIVNQAQELFAHGNNLGAVNALYDAALTSLAAAHAVALAPRMTPWENYDVLEAAAPEARAPLRTLTTIYELANYGGKSLSKKQQEAAINAFRLIEGAGEPGIVNQADELFAHGNNLGAFSALYDAADATEQVHAAKTTTDASDYDRPPFTEGAVGHHSYVVHVLGNATYASVSAEVAITYIALPTAITATATPGQQVVGGDVTVIGQLTASGAPVADATVTLYHAEDVAERIPIAATTTDALGYFQLPPFEVTGATSHVYRVHYAGDTAYAPSQSTDILVHYEAQPSEAAPAQAAPTQAAPIQAAPIQVAPAQEAPAKARSSLHLARFMLIIAAIVFVFAVLVRLHVI